MTSRRRGWSRTWSTRGSAVARLRACGAERDAQSARSAGEQQGLTRRMGPRWSRRSSGAVEDSGDVVGVADDVEDAHPPAALAADGHVDGEHSSEQIGPAETARARGVATVRRAGAGEVEVEGELLPGRGDPRQREDASTKVVAICDRYSARCAPCGCAGPFTPEGSGGASTLSSTTRWSPSSFASTLALGTRPHTAVLGSVRGAPDGRRRCAKRP